MTSFTVFEITFYIENNTITLDRKSSILTKKLIRTNKDKNAELEKQKSILNKIKLCAEFCKTINDYYKLYRCLEKIEFKSNINFDEDIKTIIYNTLDERVTRNIFFIHDIAYLNRLAQIKEENIKKYESDTSNNNNFYKQSIIQRQQLSMLKNKVSITNKNKNEETK